MESSTLPSQPTLTRVDPPGYSEAWQMVAAQLRMEMHGPEYRTWIEALRPLGYNEGIFRLGAVNSYCLSWVESRLRSRIVKLFEGLYGCPVNVKFSLIGTNAGETPVSVPATALRQEPVSTAALPLADVPDPDEPSQGDAVALTGSAPTVSAPMLPDSAPVASLPAKNGAKSANGSTNGKTNGKNGSSRAGGDATALVEKSPGGSPNGAPDGNASPRKIQLQRAYGTERARVVQPERGMFITNYLFTNWLPLLGHSAFAAILAARSLCYWNPMTSELRNVVETEMAELAKRANVSVRTIKDVLNNDLVKQYFLRYKVRRVMTSNGVRTAGIVIQVRMDDPLTPEDQLANSLPETDHWYGVDFEDEEEEEEKH